MICLLGCALPLIRRQWPSRAVLHQLVPPARSIFKRAMPCCWRLFLLPQHNEPYAAFQPFKIQLIIRVGLGDQCRLHCPSPIRSQPPCAISVPFPQGVCTIRCAFSLASPAFGFLKTSQSWAPANTQSPPLLSVSRGSPSRRLKMRSRPFHLVCSACMCDAC